MRIIGGKYRGRVIRPPKSLPVRPTTDQAKEGLFNILEHRFAIEGARVLELFAGTGNVSYEFLSRGASHVTAVDRHAACVRFIATTFAEMADGKGKAIRMPAQKFLARSEEQFDIIFMDPPYDLPEQDRLVSMIFERELLAPEGLLILEHQSADSYAHLPNFLEMRKYGGSSFSFFKVNTDS